MENLVDRRTSPARTKKSAAEVENEKLWQQVARLEKDLARNKTAVDAGLRLQDAAVLPAVAERPRA
ncbi:hypothetical protein ACF058_27685 [Streptomyces sp. NPDC015501]|uniref:hypothetical protein n=1 Tax=unclassified Streptomyces TaxID=2593676 RepID=UPI0037031B6D